MTDTLGGQVQSWSTAASVTYRSTVRADDWEALRRTIYGESRGQPFLGQVAVGWVVRNRAAIGGWWGDTVENVCFAPKQFSCWNANDPNLDVIHAASENVPSFLRASGIAALVLTGDLPDPTGGATHYFTISAPSGARTWPPAWSKDMTETTRIGAHVFFKEGK